MAVGEYRLLLLCCLSLPLAWGRSEARLESANQLVQAPFKACIDESDCSDLEGKYACFQETFYSSHMI